MIKLNKVELWCDQPDAPPAGDVLTVTQGDLDDLRRVLNGIIDVVNTLIVIAHR